ncbi:hypothetical protein [Rufibacter sp. LB8]|uniref:hypothetical protein n=1 Tax=Rufibacter sp. LB8 TaxID=2777781 RepID=UPI00178C1FB0|nr:hypothetical protein [Rufibacter sp. LB8]
MKDRLKDFVQTHREEFDSFSPRPDLWQDIFSELNTEEPGATKQQPEPVKEAKVISLNWHHAWRYAAAVALVAMLAFSAKYVLNTQNAETPGIAAAQPVTLDKIAPELKQIETRFVSVIEQKEAQLKEYDLADVNMQKEWEQEAANLDAAYAQLKQDLFTTPNKDIVIRAMSDNLKMRIAILNRQLQVLENIQTVKTQVPNESKPL